MKVVSWCPFAEPQIAAALAGVDNVSVVHVNSFEHLADQIATADALLIPGSGGLFDQRVAGLLRKGSPKLRWIQCLTSGHESFDDHGLPEGVVVTTSGGSNAMGVAEHGMGLLLALIRQIPAMVSQQQRAEWSTHLASRVDSLEGKKLAIVGVGQVGRAFAKLAKAFAMRTIGVNRSLVSSPHLDLCRSLRDLNETLSDCDIALLSLPLVADTRHLIGSAQIDCLGRRGYLVNVGRGALVNCEELDTALRGGRLAAAALDVTDPEPLPPTHPLWSNPRVLISPHLGGYGHPRSFERLAAVAKANVEAFIRGAELQNRLLPSQ